MNSSLLAPPSPSLEQELRSRVADAYAIELAIQRGRVVVTRDLMAVAASQMTVECEQSVALLQTTWPQPIAVWMCAWCGRNYNARGEYATVPGWQQPEEWSHGICPSCLAQELVAADVVHGGVAQ